MLLHNRKDKRRKTYIIGILAGLFVLASLFFAISNLLIIRRAGRRITSDSELKALQSDCILILGAGVWDGGRPSPILSDRLDEGARLYKEGVSDKILVSGDHGKTDYQSFAEGEVTPEQAHQIGIKLAEELWGDRFQVLVATHLDKQSRLSP